MGEGIIEVLMTKTLCDMVSRGEDLHVAVERVVGMTHYPAGVIALTREGRMAFYHNTDAMPVAFYSEEKKEVDVYGVQGKDPRA